MVAAVEAISALQKKGYRMTMVGGRREMVKIPLSERDLPITSLLLGDNSRALAVATAAVATTKKTLVLKTGATGEMSNLETLYLDDVVKPLLTAGVIIHYAYERLKLKLAPKTYYTPDFAMILPDGRTEYHEIKGRKRHDDSMVKFKTAAEMFPFYAFKMVVFRDKQWFTFMESVARFLPGEALIQ